MARPMPDWETPTGRTWILHSDSELFEQRVEFTPGSPFPPLHFHPGQAERFEVEQGAMLYVVEGKETRLEAGGILEVPAGAAHKARNASEQEPAVVRWETRPALRSEAFFRTAASVAGSGTLASALMAHEYRDVFRVSGVRGLVVPLLAGLARLLGRTLPG